MAARKVTIRDVAERAGVSISTVSHTFSGARTISEATRERVLQATQDLGYDPNPAARALRIGRHGLIGLVLRPKFAVSGGSGRVETYNRLLGTVTTEVLREGIGVVHVPSLDHPRIQPVPMDGCIVAHPYREDAVLNGLLARRMPTVAIEEDLALPDYPWTVRLDYTTGVNALMTELGDRGARNFALLTGTEENAWNVRTRELVETWCADHGHESRTHVLSEGLTLTDARERIRRLLAAPARPDTLVVHVSDFAALAVSAAAELGIRVPDDLMVASLSDTEGSRSALVPITAIDLNHEGMAATAVRLMLELLSGAPKPRTPVHVRPELHLRGSTAR
ncbi:LacI family DNA-binding transcriptional regulator [Actinoplanes sp. NPDC051851]|uniref:LacI family DNA-binding transcriptional regulator n=1 Tax=Actinoplanes sp. NPDC051851 TaxID=3154753 RepID=UPI003424BE23